MKTPKHWKQDSRRANLLRRRRILRAITSRVKADLDAGRVADPPQFHNSLTAATEAAIREYRLHRAPSGALIRRAMDQSMRTFEGALLVSLEEHSEGVLGRDRQRREGFEQRLYERWHLGLTLCELLRLVSLQAANDFQQRNPLRATEFRYRAQLRLHARACLISSEVFALLRSGHASGAMARWRALHEIASVAGVLADGDDQLARRYLLHGNVESLDAAIEYAQRAADLGLKPLGEDTLPDLQGKVAELCDEFGPQFRKLRGWAVPPFKSPPSIRGLEEAAGLDRSRPYYKMASYSIHAGPRGFTFDLGLMGRDNRMLAGPSNAGLADPGSRTCIALSQVSGHLISGSGRQTTTGDMVTVQTVLALSRRACAALLAAHRELAAQDREECSDEK